jgi:DNA-binding NtrC family response regulator
MRVIAASNVPLKDLVSQRLMRNDFYFRLNVITIRLVPLRMRLGDIPLLVEDFLRHHPIAIRKTITRLSPQAMSLLMKYHWPGNIRELQNVLEKAVVLARSRVIEKLDLPNLPGETDPSEDSMRVEVPLSDWIKDQEREYLIRKLKIFRGKMGLVAKSCGVDVRTIHRKMRLYGLDKKSFTHFIAIVSSGLAAC